MGAPGFWDDQATATRISTEHSRLNRKLERYEKLTGDYEDATGFVELGEEEAGVVELVDSLEAELATLEEDALFTGKYDTGDAVLEIHAGTGGTDAQDWAEMLLRMYLRWAERAASTPSARGEPGEEAGLKSRDRDRAGRERLRHAEGRARRASPGAALAVRLRPPAAHLVRAGRRGPARRRRRGGRDRRVRPADRHLPFERRGRAARQQDRLRGTHHAPPRAASSSSARTSARRRPNKATGDAASSARVSSSSRRRSARPSSRASEAPRRTSGSGVKSARTCSTHTSSSRTTEPTTRSATRSRCSTAG